MKMPFGIGSAAAAPSTASDRTRRTRRGAKWQISCEEEARCIFSWDARARARVPRRAAKSRISSSFVFVPSSRYFCGNVTFSPLPKLRFLLHLRFCQLRLALARPPALHCTACAYVYGNLGHLRFADSFRCRRRTPLRLTDLSLSGSNGSAKQPLARRWRERGREGGKEGGRGKN